jgi:hypothetical protein
MVTPLREKMVIARADWINLGDDFTDCEHYIVHCIEFK